MAGATCACTNGMGTGQIKPSNQMHIRVGGKPVASIKDVAPMVNITSCGLCTSMQKPAVAAATAAAMGTLTPQTCVPSPVGTWKCPGKVRVAGTPVLTSDGTLTCAYQGTISIVTPGQGTVKT